MSSTHFNVFSYGSNLLFKRIYERVSSVTVIEKHSLKGYKLVFNKLSQDGSTKANIIKTNNAQDCVWGMMHRIDMLHKKDLDKFEALGYGYDLHQLTINSISEPIHAYQATDNKYLATGKPYEWYHKLVLFGAIENDFPKEYISYLRSIEFSQDPDAKRANRVEHLF